MCQDMYCRKEEFMYRKKTVNSNYSLKYGFSLVELIIVIAIMAILIGVIALAVLPNIQRSRESKDITALDNIASAANTAIATTKASGGAVIKLGTTGTGVQDVTNYDSIDEPTEVQTLQHIIYQSLPDGAGVAESSAVGTDKYILFAYDIDSRTITVAYSATDTSSDTYSPIQGIHCDYIDQEYFISNLT